MEFWDPSRCLATSFSKRSQWLQPSQTGQKISEDLGSSTADRLRSTEELEHSFASVVESHRSAGVRRSHASHFLWHTQHNVDLHIIMRTMIWYHPFDVHLQHLVLHVNCSFRWIHNSTARGHRRWSSETVWNNESYNVCEINPRAGGFYNSTIVLMEDLPQVPWPNIRHQKSKLKHISKETQFDPNLRANLMTRAS